jgi:hypothetical protein
MPGWVVAEGGNDTQELTHFYIPPHLIAVTPPVDFGVEQQKFDLNFVGDLISVSKRPQVSLKTGGDNF